MTGMEVDRRPRWKRRLDNLIHHPFLPVLDVLGDNSVGSHSVPESWRMGDIRGPRECRKLGIRTDNDAFGVIAWWYYDDARPGDEPSVAFALSRNEAHRLAWWILRWWAAEWFGLRRAAYYWALHRHVTGYKERVRRQREANR